MESKCDCPAACNVTTYNADLSYAALSLDGIDSLLSDDRDEIQRKHVAAKELQDRVKSSSIIDTLQKLDRVDMAVMNFTDYWTSKIKQIETSLLYRVEKALTSAVKMGNEDVNRLFKNITHYITYYQKNLALERKWLDDMLSAGGYMIGNAIHPLIIEWRNAPNENITEPSLEAMDEFLVLHDKIMMFMDYYGNITQFKHQTHAETDTDLYFPSFAVKEQNNHQYCLHKSIVKDLTYDFPDDIGELRDRLSEYSFGEYDSYSNLTSMSYEELLSKAYGDDYDDGLVDGWNDLQRNVSQCLNEYEVYLTGVQDWLLHPLSYTSRYVRIGMEKDKFVLNEKQY